MTPSLGSIHLLEWFTELRETLYIRLLVCCKNLQLRNSLTEEMQSVWGRLWSCHAPLRVTAVPACPAQKLSGPSFGVSMQLHYKGMMG